MSRKRRSWDDLDTDVQREIRARCAADRDLQRRIAAGTTKPIEEWEWIPTADREAAELVLGRKGVRFGTFDDRRFADSAISYSTVRGYRYRCIGNDATKTCTRRDPPTCDRVLKDPRCTGRPNGPDCVRPPAVDVNLAGAMMEYRLNSRAPRDRTDLKRALVALGASPDHLLPDANDLHADATRLREAAATARRCTGGLRDGVCGGGVNRTAPKTMAHAAAILDREAQRYDREAERVAAEWPPRGRGGQPDRAFTALLRALQSALRAGGIVPVPAIVRAVLVVWPVRSVTLAAIQQALHRSERTERTSKAARVPVRRR